MLIEVSETHPPRPGGKVGYVHAADGSKFECWPDKLDGVQVGRRYEVETREREYQGRKILSITKIAPAPEQPQSRPSTGEIPQSITAGEAEYVGHVLAALIAKGDCDKAKIPAATVWLRQVWRQTQPDTEGS